MSDASYILLRFPSSERAETLQSLLLMYDPLGFLETDDGWHCYFSHQVWAESGEEIRAAMAGALPAARMEVEILDRQNWNAIWEQSIRPIRVSDRFIVHPSWHEPDDDEGCIRLVIDPKMSFGTGYHETTRLMLRLLEELDVEGRRVLDVGTGTGILAIAAMRLGAESAMGVDIDDWSRPNAEENLARNNIASGVTFRQGTFDEAEGDFDVILSNITRLDNLELLPRFTGRLRADGAVILSGFHHTDAADMSTALLSLGFVIEKEATEHEWSAIRARKHRS